MKTKVGCWGWESPHPAKCWRTRNAGSFVLIVMVFAAFFVCVAGSSRAQTFRVAGIVVNDADGAPLGTTRISLAEVQDRRKAESVITGADGRFEFRNVPAGKFSLEGARRDFMPTTYQWHEGFSTAIVTGAGLDTGNLVLRLIPLGSIAGKVIDEAGEPVRNADVKLAMHRGRLGEDRVSTRGRALTDDEGKYEFRDLIPGEYFVSAAARPWYAVYPVFANENGVRTRTDTIAPELNVAYARTYYNGATESAGATPLSVIKGERITADLHLNPVPALTVTVKAQEDSVRRYPAMLQQIDFDSPEQVTADTTSGPMPGEMVIRGVPPGRYAITNLGRSGMLAATGQVEVAEDGQVIESKAPESTSTVKVRVKTLRGEDLRGDLSLSLRDEHRHTVGYAPVTGNGEAVFEGVAPGHYAVMAHFSQPPPYTIGKMVIQGVEVEGHDITVGDGATVEVDATLMAGIVSVEGVVKRKDGKPVAGAMVALVPRGKDARTHFERIRWDQSDLDGTFTVRQILPGKYTLIAVENAWGTPWLKEVEKYLPHGQELTIGELMNAPVTLPEPVEAQTR
ncbi:MAG TPA: carboxypeptidase-like regulatory domain-containing protein [Candidatus Sulfotelmatobacter sp.]|nr:carboxypeptidase-like regulatory domain-containing protein [Candidatus Sulfotelmatobacter sp.]